MVDLRARYRAALDARLTRASAANQLDDALIWRAEKLSFEKAQTVASDDAKTPPAVKALRAEFRQQFTQLDQDRATRARILQTQYDAILAQNQTLLTQRARLDDALLLKARREETGIRARRDQGSALRQFPGDEVRARAGFRGAL